MITAIHSMITYLAIELKKKTVVNMGRSYTIFKDSI